MLISWLPCAALVALLCVSMASSGAAAPVPEEPSKLLATLKPSHPRLLVSSSTWEQLQARRRQDAALDAFLKRGEVEARALLDAPPVVYKKEGRRLLSVSRTVLRRVVLLSWHARLTGDRALVERAQTEMLAVAAFADWNPSHFLDVAEMTAALALGYDWLYHDLDVGARQTIQTAIIEKGLRAGLAHPGWMKTRNNWNSVCHAGMVLGALAVAENEPVLAAQTLQNAKDFNHFGLEPYAPDGVYPEGASYWNYGTSFQVLLLAALESALGTDWGLSQSPGFLPSAGVLEQIKGPTGTYFNFFDSGEKSGLEATFFWFARKLNQPALLEPQRSHLAAYTAQTKPPAADSQSNRLLPLAALWWPASTPRSAPQTAAAPLGWMGRGENPLATFRERWDDPNAMFLALKGGRASLNHGHMDAGSFVFESDGVRWARDLGMQDYNSLESKGIGLWDSKQNGGRWSVFRLNNFSHNTLSINNQLHQAAGQAQITHFSDARDAGAIVDLTPVFAGQASRVTRGFAFRGGSHVLIRDEIEGLKAGDTVRWAMLTKANIEVSADGTEAVLGQDGQKLRVLLQAPEGAKFEVISADPPRDFDAPNPDSRFLVASFTAPASGKLSWSVRLQRADGNAGEPLTQVELKNWPLAAAQ